MKNKRIAAFVVNYNMPEAADALALGIRERSQWPVDVYVIDNGSDLVEPAEATNIWIKENVQTTCGWLSGLEDAVDLEANQYFAYWFLITSAALVGEGDPLTPMADLLWRNRNAVGVHPALTKDSTTAWRHLISRRTGLPRRTWMIDNIASLYRANWFERIGRFDEEMIYAWGIDLETSWKARSTGRGLWVDERVEVMKDTDVGYRMGRMNMEADERRDLAGANMREVLERKYGPDYWARMTAEFVEEDWR